MEAPRPAERGGAHSAGANQLQHGEQGVGVVCQGVDMEAAQLLAGRNRTVARHQVRVAVEAVLDVANPAGERALML
jgi:hypothetical protein